jgi:hypothetical protein
LVRRPLDGVEHLANKILGVRARLGAQIKLIAYLRGGFLTALERFGRVLIGDSPLRNDRPVRHLAPLQRNVVGQQMNAQKDRQQGSRAQPDANARRPDTQPQGGRRLHGAVRAAPVAAARTARQGRLRAPAAFATALIRAPREHKRLLSHESGNGRLNEVTHGRAWNVVLQKHGNDSAKSKAARQRRVKSSARSAGCC